MPTGLFRQILYRHKNSSDSQSCADDPAKTSNRKDSPPKQWDSRRDALINLVVMLFSLLILTIGRFFFPIDPAADRFYFIGPKKLENVILFLLFLHGLLLIIKQKKYSPLINFFALTSLGYYVSELFYYFLPLKISAGFLSIITVQEALHLNQFFLHRLLSILPFLFSLILIKAYKDKYFGFFSMGRLDAKTDVLGAKNIRTWKSLLIKFFFWIVLALSLIVLINRNSLSTDFSYTLLFSILLYALWTSFFEETLFRGILLPILSWEWGFKAGILIQALLFGLIHFTPFNTVASLTAVTIFTLLGAFLGKAAKDTQGIGTSFLMHFLLIFAIELRTILIPV